MPQIVMAATGEIDPAKTPKIDDIILPAAFGGLRRWSLAGRGPNEAVSGHGSQLEKTERSGLSQAMLASFKRPRTSRYSACSGFGFAGLLGGCHAPFPFS
jgi:hypothetical protein